MPPIKDLTGQRFGRLTVLERDRTQEARMRTKHAYWRCACDCGHETTVLGASLRDGRTQSCGCLRRVRAALRWSGVIKHGTRYSYAEKGCRCDQCRKWKRERDRRQRARKPEKARERHRRWKSAHAEEHIATTRRNMKKLNDKLRETADRHGQEWTGVELEIASRPDLTARQVAVILHRTLSAVANMRQRLASDLDPRDRMLANGPQPPTSRSGPR